jgi:hypothetical protein
LKENWWESTSREKLDDLQGREKKTDIIPDAGAGDLAIIHY